MLFRVPLHNETVVISAPDEKNISINGWNIHDISMLCKWIYSLVCLNLSGEGRHLYTIWVVLYMCEGEGACVFFFLLKKINKYSLNWVHCLLTKQMMQVFSSFQSFIKTSFRIIDSLPLQEPEAPPTHLVNSNYELLIFFLLNVFLARTTPLPQMLIIF